jgi:NADH-quinone oxidoreductase subunit G
MRRNVIEWLMINHPHDCPVCDEGGECQLQDFTIAGGHGIRRYDGKKRTHVNQDLGPYIEHEMNRCIQCYRCVRFYQEYAGGTDFGVMGSAGRVYFGRFQDGQLESPFSGNLVDICPTGVFTDKTARFRARYWDYDMAPSICPHCSLGCNTTPVARYRELLKTISRRNEAVNGWFICDRGRFSNSAVSDPQRPRRALVDSRETDVAEALEALLLRIREIGELYGPGSIAVVGSARMTQEAAELLPQLAQSIVAGALCFCTAQKEHTETLTLIELLLAGRSASQQDVRNSDCIAVCGCDPLNEAPMMAIAVRQAWRTGAIVYVIGQEINLPCEFTMLDSLNEVPLAEAERPVIICNMSVRVDLLEKLQEGHSHLKIAGLLPGANSFGTAQLTREHGAISLEEAVADGEIKGIISIEADIPAELLGSIPFVAALDWQITAAVQAAQIVIPTTAWVEMDGSYTNFEGRVQQFSKVMNPGFPIKGLDPAGHPPHIHRSIAPGGEALPASQVLANLTRMLDGDKTGLP